MLPCVCYCRVTNPCCECWAVAPVCWVWLCPCQPRVTRHQLLTRSTEAAGLEADPGTQRQQAPGHPWCPPKSVSEELQWQGGHRGGAEPPPGPGQHRAPQPGVEPCSAAGHGPRQDMKEEIPGIRKLISRGADPKRRCLASPPATRSTAKLPAQMLAAGQSVMR